MSEGGAIPDGPLLNIEKDLFTEVHEVRHEVNYAEAKRELEELLAELARRGLVRPAQIIDVEPIEPEEG